MIKKKAATKARDALSAERRRLPMVRIEKNYVFDGPGVKYRASRWSAGNWRFAFFAPDLVGFYLAPPLQSDQPLRDDLESWFATFQGDIGYEIRDLSVTTAADLAYGHSFHRITGTKVAGEAVDVWFRVTLCLRQIDGCWLIAHAHESVPFYMDGSNRAAVDLQPA